MKVVPRSMPSAYIATAPVVVGRGGIVGRFVMRDCGCRARCRSTGAGGGLGDARGISPTRGRCRVRSYSSAHGSSAPPARRLRRPGRDAGRRRRAGRVLRASGHADLPDGLVAEAVVSYADTAPIEVAEHLSPFVMANSPVPRTDAAPRRPRAGSTLLASAADVGELDPTARLDDGGLAAPRPVDQPDRPGPRGAGDAGFGHRPGPTDYGSRWTPRRRPGIRRPTDTARPARPDRASATPSHSTDRARQPAAVTGRRRRGRRRRPATGRRPRSTPATRRRPDDLDAG